MVILFMTNANKTTIEYVFILYIALRIRLLRSSSTTTTATNQNNNDGIYFQADHDLHKSYVNYLVQWNTLFSVIRLYCCCCWSNIWNVCEAVFHHSLPMCCYILFGCRIDSHINIYDQHLECIKEQTHKRATKMMASTPIYLLFKRSQSFVDFCSYTLSPFYLSLLSVAISNVRMKISLHIVVVDPFLK